MNKAGTPDVSTGSAWAGSARLPRLPRALARQLWSRFQSWIFRSLLIFFFALILIFLQHMRYYSSRCLFLVTPYISPPPPARASLSSP